MVEGGRFAAWWRHAFAVDPRGEVAPTPEEAALVDRVCREVVRRRMTTPTLLFLEMSQPLNYLQAQAMHFLAPAIQAILREQSYAGYIRFARFLERRGAIDYLVRRIEELDEERDATPVGGGHG